VSWRRIKVVVRRQAYVLWRTPHRWFDIAFWPLMDVILWGSLGTYVARNSSGSQAGTLYLIAGIMLFHILFQSQIAVGTGFLEETWSRNVLNVLTTPVTEIEYLIGTAAFGMFKVLFALGTLSVTAFAFFRFDLGEVGWSVVPIALILTVVGWGVGIACIGVVLRYGQGAEILMWGGNYILMAFSGVFNPVDALPGVIQPLAKILPSTHAFSAMRDVLAGKPLPMGTIVIGMIGSVVVLFLGFAFTARMLRTFRKRGYVTRFS
jgi:ABC-2 type transport system permease protein